MKYKLLQNLPGIKAGEIISELQDTHPYSVQYKTVSGVFAKDHPDFFEPIVEKKRYEELLYKDKIFHIQPYGKLIEGNFDGHCRSETFLTLEEARDEHKRREWAVRPDRFIPKEGEKIFYGNSQGRIDDDIFRTELGFIIMANLGLLFRTEEDCEKAIKEHDLVRLFFTIR